ncbi:MAG: VOC family protein [Candidatus Nanopelagicales bacterium]
MGLMQHMYTAIDCDDPISLAKFYSELTGLRVDLAKPSAIDVSWVELKDENNQVQLAFQKIPNYRPPTWPDGDLPQQVHMDFLVDDIAEGEAIALKLGATKTQFQPGSPQSDDNEYEFRVYLDPQGHPFCLISTKKY